MKTIKELIKENPTLIKSLVEHLHKNRPTRELENVIENWIDSETQSEIKNHPEDYETYYDCGYYNNGVGMVSCGGDYEYDEEKARETVLEELDEREILENDEVRKAFLEWVYNNF